MIDEPRDHPSEAENKQEPEQERLDSGYSLPLSARKEQGWQEEWQKSRNPQAELPLPAAPVMPPPSYREIPQGTGFSLRALTEAAMMVALSAVLGIVSLYVPLLSFLGTLLYPLPMALLTMRRGLKVGLVSTVALFAISTLFSSPLAALLLLVEYGLVGLFFGYAFRKAKGPLFTLCVATVLSALGTVVNIMLSAAVSGLPFATLLAEADATMRETFSIMAEAGALDPLIAAYGSLDAYLAEASALMQKLLPAALVITSMALTLACYYIATAVLRRLRYQIPLLPKFTLWKMNWRWSWGLVAALLIELAGRSGEIAWLEQLGANLLYAFAPILFLFGLSFVIWFFKNTRLGGLVNILLIFLLVQLFSLSLYLLMLLAVLEGAYDLRGKVIKRRQKPA